MMTSEWQQIARAAAGRLRLPVLPHATVELLSEFSVEILVSSMAIYMVNNGQIRSIMFNNC